MAPVAVGDAIPSVDLFENNPGTKVANDTLIDRFISWFLKIIYWLSIIFFLKLSPKES